MSLADIRAGLAANIGTVNGLRVYTEIPDNPSMPCAVIQLNRATYDGAFQRGLTEYEFDVRLIVSRVTDRRSQQALDEFIDAGERSIKTAIESDKSLDGSAFDVRVSAMDVIDTVTIGETAYFTATFSVTVYGL